MSSFADSCCAYLEAALRAWFTRNNIFYPSYRPAFERIVKAVYDEYVITHTPDEVLYVNSVCRWMVVLDEEPLPIPLYNIHLKITIESSPDVTLSSQTAVLQSCGECLPLDLHYELAHRYSVVPDQLRMYYRQRTSLFSYSTQPMPLSTYVRDFVHTNSKRSPWTARIRIYDQNAVNALNVKTKVSRGAVHHIPRQPVPSVIKTGDNSRSNGDLTAVCAMSAESMNIVMSSHDCVA